MKTEFLKGLGIADDVISQIMAENGKDIESTKAKFADYDTLKATVKTYETEISNLKASETDNAKLKLDLETLKQQIKDNEEAGSKAIFEKNMQDRFNSIVGEGKFINDMTKDGIYTAFKSEIEKPENNGKGDSAIFEALTKDKANIFANPNPGVNIPGMGAGGGNAVELESFKKMTLLERSKIANENPAEYARLKQLTGKKG